MLLVVQFDTHVACCATRLRTGVNRGSPDRCALQMEDPMRARTLVLLVILIAIGIFAAVNWKAIVAPTTLSLVVADVQAPLGLIMLGITVLLTVLFLLFLVYLQTS